MLLPGFLFTFIIFAWAAIYHAARQANQSNPFQAFQNLFLSLNVLIGAVICVLFVLMAQSHDVHQVYVYSLVGSLITAITAISMSVGFTVYGVLCFTLVVAHINVGLLLVRSLTRDFTSSHAKKLFVVACSFGLAFAGESITLVVSVLNEELFVAHFDAMVKFRCHPALILSCRTACTLV